MRRYCRAGIQERDDACRLGHRFRAPARQITYPDAQFIREELDNLVLAEELGFDSVWITEHHFSDYSLSNDPLQLLTYIAGRTKRIKLGTQCIIVPWHNPVRLAEKIVNLDIMSGGRAILGFGGGLAPHEFAGLGIDQNKARALYTDILDVLIPALETGVHRRRGRLRHPAARRIAARARSRASKAASSAARSVGHLDARRGQARLRQHGADAAAARQGGPARSLCRSVGGRSRRRQQAARPDAGRQLLYR